jgi:Transferase family
VRNWPLSAIDRYAFRWVIQGTWVFDRFLDADQLKQGLARLLDAYPILSGRVVAGRLIAWVDADVPFSEAEQPRVSVADFGAATVDAARFADRPNPARMRQGRAPLLTVRLTRIADGCVLALSASHACVDGKGFYALARNFARAATGRPIAMPSFERTPAPPRRSRREVAQDAKRLGWLGPRPVDLQRLALGVVGYRRRRFVAHFSPAALARCKAELAAASGCDRLSTNSALIAHVAQCTARLVGLSANETFSISSAVDMRGRAGGLTDEYAGNGVALAATSEIPANAAASEIAAKLHACLKPLLGRPSPELEALAALTQEVAEHAMLLSPVQLSRMLMRKPTLFYTNSFSKLPVYDLDFGSESHPILPVRVVPHNLGDPILLWPAPPDKGGIELYFSGSLARAVGRLGESDPWWEALGRFESAGSARQVSDA